MIAAPNYPPSLEIVQAGSGRLVSAATLREAIGAEAAEDDRLSTLLAAVEAAFCGADGMARPFRRAQYSETVTSSGASLQLGVWPIERVLSVTDLETGLTVDPGDYALVRNWSGGSWLWHSQRLAWPGSRSSSGSQVPRFRVVYVGGWILPDQLRSWAAASAVSVGALVQVVSGLFAEATTAGTTGSSAPAWPDVEGHTLVDGSVTWTIRRGALVPEDLVQAAVYSVAQLRREFAGGERRVKIGPLEVEQAVFATVPRGVVPDAALAVARRYR